jgi:glycosyltransferase involved in cell wall biosynthesis
VKPYLSDKFSGMMIEHAAITSEAMQETIRISVVIPTYNRSPLLRRAVKSVQQQSKQPAEIIVVDDGSTDDTAQRVASFGPAVHYICQANAGTAAARNRGVHAAQSEWIAFLDSDDIWFEAHLERMAQAICATAGAAQFYFADALLPAREGGHRLWEICRFGISGNYELVQDATDWVMTDWPPMLLQSSVFERTSFLESGGFWERLRTREDTHLFLKLGIGGSACAVAGCGVRLTDDDADNRLTATHSRTQPDGQWMKVLLYRNILSRKTNLRPAHRQELQGRLAAAHRRLAYLAWKRRLPVTAAWQAGHSLLLEPRLLVRSLARMARRQQW